MVNNSDENLMCWIIECFEIDEDFVEWFWFVCNLGVYGGNDLVLIGKFYLECDDFD